MSLLTTSLNNATINAAQLIHDAQIAKLSKFNLSFSTEQQQTMLEGTLNNLLYLKISVDFKDSSIYIYYIKWIYNLLRNHIKNMNIELLQMYLADHYSLVLEQIPFVFTEENCEFANELVLQAIATTLSGSCEKEPEDYINIGSYIENKKVILNYLLEKDIQFANAYIKNIFGHIRLEDLYTDIIQGVMREVGELWYQDKISVAQEHYCTMAAQTIMAQFYDYLFEHPRRGKKIVIACPGNELHELGARMISDLFEYNGWDSIFLGAAVPIKDILSTIEQEKPQVCALSVCMTQGIPACQMAVEQIKEKFPDVIVTVGGRAFEEMENVKDKIGTDLYCSTFSLLLHALRALGI